ncbi:MAG: transposase [Thermoleophilia bacterium]|nr:transposase [Thermoleophilia bacterium]
MPVGLATAGANRNDHKLLRQTIDSIPIARPEPTGESPQGLCLDKGYDYPEVREIASELDLTLHLRTRGEEIEAKRSDPDFIARRWVVERSHSWLNRNRGLLIRWPKKPENHRAFHHLAFGVIAWRAALTDGLPR